MKTKMSSEQYQSKLGTGEIETASLLYPKNTALRMLNTLLVCEAAGLNVPSPVSGETIDRLTYQIEQRGVIIPGHKLAGVELRSLSDSVRPLNLKIAGIEVRKDMSERDKENWRSQQLAKNGFHRDSSGQWIKL